MGPNTTPVINGVLYITLYFKKPYKMGFFLGWLKVINSQTSLLIGFFSFSNPRAEAKALSRATTKISDVWGVVLAFLGGRMEWGF